MSDRLHQDINLLRDGYAPDNRRAVFEYIKQLEAEKEKLKSAIEEWKKEEVLWKELESEFLIDSKRLDKLLKQECRHYYGGHPDDFEMIESREDIDKLEEPE